MRRYSVSDVENSARRKIAGVHNIKILNCIVNQSTIHSIKVCFTERANFLLNRARRIQQESARCPLLEFRRFCS